MAVDNLQDYERTHFSRVIIAADRGVNQASLFYDLVIKGAFISGTVPKVKASNNQPFITYSSRALMDDHSSVPNAHHIIENATRSSFWVARTLPKHHTVNLLAVRQGHGNKIVYLATSDPDLGPGTYILEKNACQHKESGYYYNNDGKLFSSKQQKEYAASQDGCINVFARRYKIRILTERQSESIWFLLR